MWTVKLSKTGDIIWNKVYGGTGYEISFDVLATPDSCYLIAGEASANNGDVSGFHGGDEDAWLLKINDTGGIVWAKTYGGSNDDVSSSIVRTTSGAYVLVGGSNSTDGDVSNNHGLNDFWAVGIDDTGRVLWNNSYGGSSDEISYGGKATLDGGVLITGSAYSNDSEVTNNHGSADFWAIKINDTGALIWENSYGGNRGDTALTILQTADSGYVVGGVTASSNDDVTGNHGKSDMWVVKLNKFSTTKVTTVTAAKNIQVYPTLTGGVVHVMMPQGYEHATITMTDVTGNQCGSIPVASGVNRTVNISNVPAGMYLLQVVNGSDVNTYKVVYHP